MRYYLPFLLVAAASLGAVHPARAQYPTIPPAVQAKADAALADADKRSEAAWQRALLFIEQEARQGKSYIPWAAKPSDLPQSSRLAFPGAEGGGAHCRLQRGGQGGRVLVVKSLADSGPGTLREALEQGGARIVVFNVAGIIRLQSPLSSAPPTSPSRARRPRMPMPTTTGCPTSGKPPTASIPKTPPMPGWTATRTGMLTWRNT